MRNASSKVVVFFVFSFFSIIYYAQYGTTAELEPVTTDLQTLQGEWKGTWDNPRQNNLGDAKLIIEGSKATVVMESRRGDVHQREGNVELRGSTVLVEIIERQQWSYKFTVYKKGDILVLKGGYTFTGTGVKAGKFSFPSGSGNMEVEKVK